ncbi:MAG: HD domain-containing protein [Lachnospiraceae bacterium]|nr:HD domain-containing protein [Lachnospiraceae bacterium]
MTHYINLSEETGERIRDDRSRHAVNPYACRDEDVIRRDPSHDRANLHRPAFVRDIEKIMNVPYYNRYSDKTQVFSLVRNDDISRRALHVQFVSRIARNIGRLLDLNIDLIEAIALGHDIGHTPFGHAGERTLSDIYHSRTGRYFNHNVHSVRVLDDICCQNLSLQTLDGIICHNGEMELKEYRPRGEMLDFEAFDEMKERCYTDRQEIKHLIPCTLEGCVVRVSDIIAYIGKDRQDAERLGLFEKEPVYSQKTIGTTNAEMINNMIVNIVENSYGKPYLKMDDEYFEELAGAKRENYSLIYGNEKTEAVFKKDIEPMFEEMYAELVRQAESMDPGSVFVRHHIDYIERMTRYVHVSHRDYRENNVDDMVVDYIAGMTDDYFIDLYSFLFPGSGHRVKYTGYFD